MFNNWKMKLGKYSADHPVKLASFVAVFSFVLVFFISLKYWIKDYDGFLENIVVESYGMVFDLLVIGVFVLWLNRLGEKRRDEKRYSEQIDDLRDWNSVEASFQAYAPDQLQVSF